MCPGIDSLKVGNMELGPALVQALAARQAKSAQCAARKPQVNVEVYKTVSKPKSCLKRSRDEGSDAEEPSAVNYDASSPSSTSSESREASPLPGSPGSGAPSKRRRVNISHESEYCYFYASDASSKVSSLSSSPSSSRISSPEPASPPVPHHALAQAFSADITTNQDLDFMCGLEQTKVIDGPALESFIVDKLITLWAKGPNPKAIVPVLSFLVTSGSLELLASVHGRLIEMCQRVMDNGKVTLLPSAVILGPTSVASLSFLAESVRRASLLFTATPNMESTLQPMVGEVVQTPLVVPTVAV